jgi:hypothetical protein
LAEHAKERSRALVETVKSTPARVRTKATEFGAMCIIAFITYPAAVRDPLPPPR